MHTLLHTERFQIGGRSPGEAAAVAGATPCRRSRFCSPGPYGSCRASALHEGRSSSVLFHFPPLPLSETLSLSLSIYICIYIHVYVSLSMNIYIYACARLHSCLRCFTSKSDLGFGNVAHVAPKRKSAELDCRSISAACALKLLVPPEVRQTSEARGMSLEG